MRRTDEILSGIILGSNSTDGRIPKGARGRLITRGGTGIPVHEVDALARILLPKIQAFFESEEGQREFAEWKAQQEKNKVK